MKFDDNENKIGLYAAMVSMSDKLKNIISTVIESAGSFTIASNEINSTAQKIAQSVNAQAATAEEVSASIEEMTANFQQNTDNSQETDKIATKAAAEMLGFDLLDIANEGKVVIVAGAESAEAIVSACKKHPLGKDACILGTVVDGEDDPIVELVTKIGGRRMIQMPYGRELPRIC